jgi:hypothetical protein
MENPHKLLQFKPTTKSGYEVLFIAEVGTKLLNLIVVLTGPYGSFFIDSELDGKELAAARDIFDLVPTDTEPYANQPYTLWQAQQEKEAIVSERDTYKWALKDILELGYPECPYQVELICESALKQHNQLT